jgi:hypothetical protein
MKQVQTKTEFSFLCTQQGSLSIDVSVRCVLYASCKEQELFTDWRVGNKTIPNPFQRDCVFLTARLH